MRAAAMLAMAAALAFAEGEPLLWRPAPAEGRLEVTLPGGWTGTRVHAVRVTVVVDGDPRPATPPHLTGWEAWVERRKAWQAAVTARTRALLPGATPAQWALLPLLDWRGGTQAPTRRLQPGEAAFLARAAEAERQAEAELEQADRARVRTLRIWCNGRAHTVETQVNRPLRVALAPRAGENRLEILDLASGSREVRTWWQEGGAAPRLQVLADGDTQFKVMAPSGKVGPAEWEHRHPSPAPGTYTVLWSGWEATSHGAEWGFQTNEPRVVTVEVLLDAGTDRERVQRFSRTCLPGEGEVVLGRFHVED